MAGLNSGRLWRFLLMGDPGGLAGGAGAQTREIALGCGHILDANYMTGMLNG